MGKAAALHKETQRLRDLTQDAAPARPVTISKGVLREPRACVEIVGETPKSTTMDGMPFAHPMYWAAFVVTGDPD